jgi:hypothetical protein
MRHLPFLAALLLAAIAIAGCSSTQDVLNPSAIAAAPPAAGALAAEGDAGLAAGPVAPAAEAALVPSRTRLRFDPMVGASVAAATPLTERLAARARSRRIAVAGSDDPDTTHVLKGYFSTIAEGKNTTIIYVWDVYDPAGNRLHRIDGRQKAAGGGGDWSAATPATMQAIADDTIDQLAAWLAGRPS